MLIFLIVAIYLVSISKCGKTSDSMGTVHSIHKPYSLCFSSQDTVPLYFTFFETLQLTIESNNYGSMLFTMDKGDSKSSCDEINVMWNLWRYGIDHFHGQSNRLSIGMSYFKDTCITFCPYFSNEPFSYKLTSSINFIKVIVTLVGIILVLFSSNLINRFWILYSLIGFFVGGVLWTSSLVVLLKTLPKIPSRLKIQFLLGTIPFLTSTTYGIVIYFKYFLFASIVCFFVIGVIATYWYGEPSERSITLVSNGVKFFGLVLIIVAQSDHWPSVIFITSALFLLLSISFCLQTFDTLKRMGSSMVDCFSKVKMFFKAKNSHYCNKTMSLAFPFISKEQFELEYLNTPHYLYELANIIREDPLLIRRIKKCNRAVVALFCIDPESYLLTRNDESGDEESNFSDNNETIYYSDSESLTTPDENFGALLS